MKKPPAIFAVLILIGATTGPLRAAEITAAETVSPVEAAPLETTPATTNAPPGRGTNAPAAVVKDKEGPRPSEWAFYKIITDRNIFNPNRSPGLTNRPPRDGGDPTPRTDWFTLKGTMSYEEKAYAFFEGTGSQFNGGFKANDAIGGYKIAEIAGDHINLAASADKTIELRVGMQMRRVGSGPWTLVASPDLSAAAETGDSGSSAGSSSGSSSGGGSSANVDEVMKRLMERRAKESGQ